MWLSGWKNSWAIPRHFIMSSYLLMFEGTLVRRLRGACQDSVFSFLSRNFSSVRSILIVHWMGSNFIDTTLYPKQEIVYFKTPQG